jgi:hypothetical protein
VVCFLLNAQLGVVKSRECKSEHFLYGGSLIAALDHDADALA